MVVSPFPSTLNWLFGVSRNLYNIHIVSHSNTKTGVFSALQHPEPPVQNDPQCKIDMSDFLVVENSSNDMIFPLNKNHEKKNFL